MTARPVPEWVGKHPNSRPTWACIERLLEKQDNRCAGPCQQRIGAGNPFDADHIVELKDGGENRESNLQLLCRKICHKHKTRKRNVERNSESRTRRYFAGWKKPKGRPMPGTKASGWKKTLNHGWVRRDGWRKE